MANMKRDDIERRHHYGRAAVPAINVKHHFVLGAIDKKFRGTRGPSPFLCAECGTAKHAHAAVRPRHRFVPGGEYTIHEFGDDATFWEWVDYVEEHVDDAWDWPRGLFARAEDIAREDGWERAKELAYDVWGSGQVQVYQEGRSGGWLVVHGLGDIDEWDAIEVSRWARFQRGVKETVADLDYQFVWHLYENVYEHVREMESIA